MSAILEGIIWGLAVAAAILFLLTIILVILHVLIPLLTRDTSYVAMVPAYLLIGGRST